MKPSSPATQDYRSAQTAAVLRETVARRAAGEPLTDEAVMEANPHLLPELRLKLEALRRVEEAERWASTSAQETILSPASGGETPALARPPRTTLAGCVLHEELHRGGQGVVYRAVQQATGRPVAVKVLREGPFLSVQDRARFEREVRILAQLKHPNIVTIHDSGSASGCHYFVMDYIDGVAFDTYVAARCLSLDSKLRLFATVCTAVHAAHLRGVIHRDLKPGNILIDESGSPHVLDFGLARPVAEHEGEETVWRTMTQPGQFVGSLPWASPEQASGSPDKIDVRTDVYALGVILYHTLTGRFPYPVIGAMREVLGHIADTEPVRIRSLQKDVPEDVEAIILKCLAKEPERRYDGAGAIAEDIRRFLEHQPILARAPSTIYQLKKLVVRNKLPSALVGALFVLMTIFAGSMTVLYGQAETARRRAVSAEAVAATERDAAEREARTASAVNDFLIHDMLASAQPQIARGRKITVEEVLDSAAEDVDEAFGEEPLVEASVRQTIAESYFHLGLYAKAEPHYQRAVEIRTEQLGPSHPHTLRAKISLANTLHELNRIKEASDISGQTLTDYRDALGEDDPDTLRAAFIHAEILWRLGEVRASVALHGDVLQRRTRVLGREHIDTIGSVVRWGCGLDRRLTNTTDVERTLRSAWKTLEHSVGPQHPDTLRAMSTLGRTILLQRRFEEAGSLLHQAYDGLREILGERHPHTLLAAMELATWYKESNQMSEAIVRLRTSAEAFADMLGPEHPSTLDVHLLLGNTLVRAARLPEATEVYRRVLDSWGREAEPDQLVPRVNQSEHPTAADVSGCLYMTLAKLGYIESAVDGLRDTLDAKITADEDRDVITTQALQWLTWSLAAINQPEEARSYAKQLLAMRAAVVSYPEADAYQLNLYARLLLSVVPKDLRDPQLALQVALQAMERSTDEYHYNRYTLARAYEANGDLGQALAYARRALTASPLEHSEERAMYETLLVRLLEVQGDRDAAAGVYRDTLAARLAELPSDHPDIATTHADLGVTLLRHGQFAEAEGSLREVLRIRRANFGEDFWLVPPVVSALGEAVAGQGRGEEGEQLLLEGYHGFGKLELASRYDEKRALERLVAFYEAQGNDVSAAQYQAILQQPEFQIAALPW